MKHLVKTSRACVAAFAVIGLIAFASYLTRGEVWDGGFPACEFRINVRDTEDNPIRGAILRVYRGSTRDLASGYPLDNHKTGQELVSDANGRITAVRAWDGTQFGGTMWRLFWCIPMGERAPKYDCEITAENFRPAKFSLQHVFDSPSGQRTKIRDHDGNQVEVQIFEQAFTLKR